MKLRNGFYVSSNGEHVIELFIKENKFFKAATINFNGFYMNFDGWNINKQLKVLISGWEYLGE